MVREYLSVNIGYSPFSEGTNRQQLHIAVNGVGVGFSSNTDKNEFERWKEDITDPKILSKLAHNYKIVLDLMELVLREHLEPFNRVGINSDPALIANFFAKDGWKLCKVRNSNQYLLFEREI